VPYLTCGAPTGAKERRKKNWLDWKQLLVVMV